MGIHLSHALEPLPPHSSEITFDLWGYPFQMPVCPWQEQAYHAFDGKGHEIKKGNQKMGQRMMGKRQALFPRGRKLWRV